MIPTIPIGHHFRCESCGKPVAEKKKCFRCSRILCTHCTESQGGLLFCSKCSGPKTTTREKKLLALTESDIGDI